MDCLKPFSLPEISWIMPCELEWFHSQNHESVWVFWSKNKDEFQRLQSLHSTGGTFTDNGAISEKITNMLQRLTKFGRLYLVQFWVPVVIGDRMYLTISDQPFALTQLVNGLCSYRKLCLDYLLPVDEEACLGPVVRVFRNGLPEFSLDIHHYSTQEYLQRDHAVDFGVQSYLALPIFEPLGCNCVGVLEVTRAVKDGFPKYTVDTLIWNLKEVDLRSSYVYCRFDMQNSECPRRELHDIKKALKVVCRTHQLPLAQTWVPSSDASGIEKVMTAEEGSCIVNFQARSFAEACGICYIQKGQGVVGKAFASKGACFCKNISQISISEYSLVSSARKVGLTGCFAICLQSIDTGDFIYLIEYFLPLNETQCSDPSIFLKELMTTMKKQFKSFKVASGQKLGETLFVEVLKTYPTDELDSFEICHFTGHRTTPEVGESQYGRQTMLQQELETDSTEQCDSSDSGNQKTRKRIDREYGINMEVLQQHSAKKLKDVANVLGVSRSTLKRICREHNIYKWPPRNAKRRNCSDLLNHPEATQPAKEHIGDSTLKELPLGNLPVEDVHTKEEATRLQGGSSIVIKVTYQNDIVKFDFSASSGKLDLEEEVAKRFNLSIGSFNLKYLDEDNDLILVTCDADLRTCIRLLTSLGRNTIKMVVNLLQVK